MDQITRIMHMERLMEEVSSALSCLEKGTGTCENILPALEELRAYYTGPLWRADFEDDEAGLLPPDLKRGVLSEDGLWDLLERFENKHGGNSMKKNFGAETWLYPMPVFIIGTYNEDGTPNAMNAAWGGTANTKKIAICVDKGHKTTENFLSRKAFTVAIADRTTLVASDYVGIVSGFDVPDKISRAGLTPVKSAFVDAPCFEEYKMTLECTLVSYDDESELLIGEIINISADESILGEDGQIDVLKLQPITYDPVHHGYHVVGEKVGTAFSDGNQLDK